MRPPGCATEGWGAPQGREMVAYDSENGPPGKRQLLVYFPDIPIGVLREIFSYGSLEILETHLEKLRNSLHVSSESAGSRAALRKLRAGVYDSPEAGGCVRVL